MAVALALSVTTGCAGDAQRVAAEVAQVRASASASVMDAERHWIAVEAQEAAEAAAREANPEPAAGPSSARASDQALDPDQLDPEPIDPAASPGVATPGGSAQAARVQGAGGRQPSGGDDAASFAALEARLGPIGIAVAPVGGGAVTAYGSVTAGVAWSTIKVPLSVAAVRADGGRPSTATSALIRRAVTVSDNAAAERLWARLGGGAKAAAAVNAVLADGGDTVTRVPAARLRPGFSVFGQTRWSLGRAAAYAARLPCQRGAAPVLTQMGRIAAGQRWGLGSLGASARFKGGWGPDPSGAYLVRQLGVITLADGRQVGVAIASRPRSGAFTDGQTALTGIARWLATRRLVGGAGRC